MQAKDKAARNPGPRLYYLRIPSLAVLQAVYMPYIRNGGLFLPVTGRYDTGDRLFVVLRLLEESRATAVVAQVVWLAPPGCHGPHRPGIGVQFNDGEHLLKRRMDQYLAGSSAITSHAAM